jgi:hypothetical protein
MKFNDVRGAIRPGAGMSVVGNHRAFEIQVAAILCTALAWAACGGQTVGTAASSDASTDGNGKAPASSSGSSGGELDGSSSGSAAEEAGLPPGSPPPPLPPLTGFGPGCFPQGVPPGASYATDAGCLTNQYERCSDGGFVYQATCACPQGVCVCIGSSTSTVTFTGCPTCPTLPQAFKLCGFPQ